MSKEPLIARYHHKSEKFEILVDPELVWKYKSGESINLEDVLISDTIYSDAKKGDRASLTSLQKVFNTTDPLRIAKIIIERGEVPLTAEQRRRLIEENRRKIINFISKNCIDPRTNAPIPPKRVEILLEEVKVNIDPLKDVEVQAMEVIKVLSRVIPIKIAKAIIAVRIPPAYIGKSYGIIEKFGRKLRDAWLRDGSWACELEIPAGLQDALISKVNELTKGEGEVKIIKVV